MILGPNTKSAISRIVAALPFLKAGENGIPTAQRGVIEQIRRGALTSSEGARDVQIVSAEAWATAELEAALEADKPAAEEPAENPTPIEFPNGVPSVPPPVQEASIIGGGVAVHEKPLGDLSDAELEKLTAPEKEGK